MKKSILSLTISCFLVFESVGQLVISTDRNAVVHSQFTRATTDTANYKSPSFAITTVQYLDGLGRPIQKVGFRHGNGGNGQDIIYEDITYDAFNRPVRTTLPTAALLGTQGRDGTYKPDAVIAANLFYQETTAYNETTEFDNSPLNRPKVMYGAGKIWRDSLRNTQLFYGLAGSEVRRYVKSSNGNIAISGMFPANSLFKNTTVDEQRDTTITFTDKQGRLVQQWVQDENGYIITSYVYDGLDRPLAIIQPEGYEMGGNFAYNSTKYQNYIFAYEYDERGRTKRKHVPGGGWTSYVYDKRDQVVLEQSALQELDNLWSFVKYDAFGRVAITGELESNRNQNTLQADFDGIAVPFETRTVNSYDDVSFPLGVATGAYTERQFFYYDNHDWVKPVWEFDPTYPEANTYYYEDTKGLLTGSWSKSTLDTDSLYTTLRYDNKGRVITTHETYPNLIGTIPSFVETRYIENQYYFNGVTSLSFTNNRYNSAYFDVYNSLLINNIGTARDSYGISFIRDPGVGVSSGPDYSIDYSYDGLSRLNRTRIFTGHTSPFPILPDYVSLPPNPVTSITQTAKKAITFEIGTLIEPQNTGTYLAYIDSLATDNPSIYLQTLDYSYHLRGGLLGVNLDGNKNPVPKIYEGDLFSYKLDYEQSGRWDGNIGRQRWQSTDTFGTQVGERSYTYAYDAAKRLKRASYSGSENEDFSIPTMSYDKNGNISFLARNGKTATGFGAIDRLFYGYSGNRLTTVSDIIQSNNEVDLVPRNGGIYTYYPDGSLKSDANEGISLIIYDTFLRQPKEVQLTDGRKIKNFYDGSGRMLKTDYLSAVDVLIESWDYMGDMIFRNDTAHQLNNVGYRMILEKPATGGDFSQWNYEFDYQDHLGNTRVSYKDSSGHLIKTAETAFDPWGVRLNGVGSVNGFQNRWEMQGKEREQTFGLNRVNFGARVYNPTIGRFDRVDPLAEIMPQISVYAYNYNNPVKFIDPDGLMPIDSNGIQRFFAWIAKDMGMNFELTGALTYGTIAAEGEIDGIKAGIDFSVDQTDIVGVRNNKYKLMGYESGAGATDAKVQQTNMGINLGLIGFEKEISTKGNSNNQTVLENKNSFNIGGSSLESSNLGNSMSTQLYGFKLGLLIGIDVKLEIKTDLNKQKKFQEPLRLSSSLRTGSSSATIMKSQVSKVEAAEIKNYINNLK